VPFEVKARTTLFYLPIKCNFEKQSTIQQKYSKTNTAKEKAEYLPRTRNGVTSHSKRKNRAP